MSTAQLLVLICRITGLEWLMLSLRNRRRRRLYLCVGLCACCMMFV